MAPNGDEILPGPAPGRDAIGPPASADPPASPDDDRTLPRAPGGGRPPSRNPSPRSSAPPTWPDDVAAPGQPHNRPTQAARCPKSPRPAGAVPPPPRRPVRN